MFVRRKAESDKKKFMMKGQKNAHFPKNLNHNWRVSSVIPIPRSVPYENFPRLLVIFRPLS